jgi:hypothetical protein
VGHEYLLQELTQTLLMVSKSRTGVPSNEVIGVLLQDVQRQNDALDALCFRASGQMDHPAGEESGSLLKRLWPKAEDGHQLHA